MPRTAGESEMGDGVVIVGGGLAGLAAAVGLAQRGLAVSVCESRGRLGGRASSFHDTASGQLIDTCQHVSMGCCTNLAHFCQTVGIARHLRPQKTLYFMTPDRRVSHFFADPLPAPLHLARCFAGLHSLRFGDKCRIAWGLACLRRASEERLRVARELHDVLAHNISLINVQAGVALHLMDEQPEQARPALTAIKQASKE